MELVVKACLPCVRRNTATQVRTWRILHLDAVGTWRVQALRLAWCYRLHAAGETIGGSYSLSSHLPNRHQLFPAIVMQ
jgi:hypothetical protein